jgi:hypothetical protein
MPAFLPKSRRLLAAVLAILLAFVPAVGEAGPGEWASVVALKPGSVVRITTAALRVRGSVSSVDEASLTISVDRQSVTVPRSAVLRVVESKGRAIGRDSLRGLAIGGIIGAAWWAIVSRNRAVGAAAGGAYGALDGAILGALVGIGDSRERVVYERAQPDTRGDLGHP